MVSDGGRNRSERVSIVLHVPVIAITAITVDSLVVNSGLLGADARSHLSKRSSVPTLLTAGVVSHLLLPSEVSSGITATGIGALGLLV